MEPSPKRARLSGEESEDGPTPPSLFDISFKAMIENAKNNVYPIEVNKISPLVTDEIWKKSSFLDIIENIRIPGTFELYSNRVIRPRKFRVWNHKTIYRDHELVRHCDLYIKFDDGRALEWKLKYTPPGSSYSHPEGPILSFKIGAKHIKAIIDNPDEKNFTLHTNLSKAWSSRFGIIKWLTKTFRCEVDEIHFRNELKYHFEHLNKWDLKSVRSLDIKQCDNSEWLRTILQVRKNKNLKTSIDILNCLQPLPLCLLESIEVSYIKSKLPLRQDELIAYASTALKCIKERVEFKIPDFTSDQVKVFQSRLNLSEDLQLLNEQFEYNCYREKRMKPTTTLYSINDNGTAFVYYFMGETPGVFNELLGFVRKAKPQPVQ
ncbi:unnamed protein product [Caenorhabditis brenneri]